MRPLLLLLALALHAITISTLASPTPTPVQSSQSQTQSQTLTPLPPSFLTLLHTTLTSSTNTHSLHPTRTFAHNTSHFTQGLVIDNDISLDGNNAIELYESTGIWGGTYVYKYRLNVKDDEKKQQVEKQSNLTPLPLLSSIKLPSTIFGEGICLLSNQEVLQLTWQNQKWFKWKREVFESQPGDAQFVEVEAEASSSTAVSGATAVPVTSSTGVAASAAGSSTGTAASATGSASPSSSTASSSPPPPLPPIPSTPKLLIASPSDYQTIPYPHSTVFSSGSRHVATWKEGWGVTRNTFTNQIVVSDGTASLYLLQEKDLSKIVKKLDVHYLTSKKKRIPVPNLNELEYIPHPDSVENNKDQGEIFANLYETYCILRIHPESGRILGVLVADEKVFYEGVSEVKSGEKSKTSSTTTPSTKHPSVDAMNGIAFHTESQSLFITGKLWPRLYQVEVRPLPPVNVQQKGNNESARRKQYWSGDLTKRCPKIKPGRTDMQYWQNLLTKTAEQGAKLDQQVEERKKKEEQAENQQDSGED